MKPDDAINKLFPITADMDASMIAFTQVARTYCANLKARRTSQSTDTKNKEEQI